MWILEHLLTPGAQEMSISSDSKNFHVLKIALRDAARWASLVAAWFLLVEEVARLSGDG